MSAKTTARSEPALTTGTITALVGAAIVLVVSFGLDLSKEQVAAITGFVAVLAPLVSGFITRRQVTPSSEVAAQVAPDGSFVAGDGLSTVETGQPVKVGDGSSVGRVNLFVSGDSPIDAADVAAEVTDALGREGL